MSLMDSLMYATNGSGSIAALEHDGSNNLKIAVVSNTSGVGDASASNQATQITQQGTANGHLSAIETSLGGTLLVDGSGATQPVSAVSLPLPSGASTSANQGTIVGLLSGTLTTDGSATTQPVSAVSLPLPSGASTSANQSTAIGHLSTIAGAVSGSEVQVDIVSSATITNNTDKTSATSSLWSAAVLGASSFNNQSGVLDFQDYSVLQIVGNTTNTSDPIYMEFSTNNTTYYRDNMNTIYPDGITGDFVVSFPNVACRYVRAVKDNNGLGSETITLVAAVRKN